MIRVLIVDDEPPARAKLRRYLAGERGVEVAGEATCGREAVELIASLAPDLVFLDVQMPDMTGFEVVDALGGEAAPHVVFVTAHEQYAVRAFEIHALDYLLKPVGPDRFASVLERARAAIERPDRGDLAARLASLLESLPAPRSYAERILVPVGERSIFLEVGRIDRVRADRNYVILYAGGAEYTLRGTMDALQRRLDPARFLRANRSEIVRIEAVREVQPWFHGDYRLVLSDGAEVAWTRRFVDRAPDTLLRTL